MKKILCISNFLYLFALSLWVGGMFLLGILVEIFVRIKLKDQPLVASDIMNGIMDVFNVQIIYWCIGLMVFAMALRFFADKKNIAGYVEPRVTKRKYSKEVVLMIMVVLALYIGSVLRPDMHALDVRKKANPQDVKLQLQFDRYHTKLTWIYSINMILGLSLFYMHGMEMTRFREDDVVENS